MERLETENIFVYANYIVILLKYRLSHHYFSLNFKNINNFDDYIANIRNIDIYFSYSYSDNYFNEISAFLIDRCTL